MKSEKIKVLAGSLKVGDRFSWGSNEYEVFRVLDDCVIGHCEYPRGNSQVMGVPLSTEVTLCSTSKE